VGGRERAAAAAVPALEIHRQPPALAPAPARARGARISSGARATERGADALYGSLRGAGAAPTDGRRSKYLLALHEKSKDELSAELENLRKELSELRVAQVANSSAAQKVNRIREVRKKIARVLTVMTIKTRKALREKHTNSKFLPKDLRPKLTRALRRRLSKAETHVLATAQKGGVAKKLVPRVTAREAKKRVIKRAARVVFAVKAE